MQARGRAQQTQRPLQPLLLRCVQSLYLELIMVQTVVHLLGVVCRATSASSNDRLVTYWDCLWGHRPQQSPLPLQYPR